jgi:hypothetical protein
MPMRILSKQTTAFKVRPMPHPPSTALIAAPSGASVS